MSGSTLDIIKALHSLARMAARAELMNWILVAKLAKAGVLTPVSEDELAEVVNGSCDQAKRLIAEIVDDETLRGLMDESIDASRRTIPEEWN